MMATLHLNFLKETFMIKVNPYHVLNFGPKENFPCLSIYASSEQELSHLLGTAEELGLKKYDRKTLGPLFKSVNEFLSKRKRDGDDFPIALFSTQGFAGYSRLPFSAKPLAVVSDSFHIKPLLKWMQREHPFSLLHLKDQEAVLYHGSLSNFEEMERHSYYELRTMDGVFNALDRAVYRSIQSSGVPLLLAGEFDLIEAYKSISGYKAIVDDAILDPSVLIQRDKLHAAAIRVLEPFLEQKENSFLNAYWAAERRGKASAVLQEIVQLALAGRVKHLFINEKLHVWGKIDVDKASFSYSSKQTAAEDDVLDDLAEIVIRKYGAVTVLPSSKMPNGKAACAILSAPAAPLRQSKTVLRIAERNWQPQAAS